jgi:hypothetical protein
MTTYTLEGTEFQVHSFTSLGTSNFVVSDEGSDNTVDYLIVAGGGGGSNYTGGAGGRGGAGAGGLLQGLFSLPSAQSFPAVIGAGGLGNKTTTVNSNGFSGGNSSIFGLTSFGGGSAVSGNGGSGAGAALNTSGNSDDQGPIGLGTSGQGNNGGLARNGQANVGRGGGGGGAGQVGQSGRVSGNGGNGLQSFIRTGLPIYYAGGAGGNGHPSSSPGFQGSGGLGGGANGILTGNGNNGATNTGGGGGSGGITSGNVGGDGGSGIVVVRYPLTKPKDFTLTNYTEYLNFSDQINQRHNDGNVVTFDTNDDYAAWYLDYIGQPEASVTWVGNAEKGWDVDIELYDGSSTTTLGPYPIVRPKIGVASGYLFFLSDFAIDIATRTWQSGAIVLANGKKITFNR